MAEASRRWIPFRISAGLSTHPEKETRVWRGRKSQDYDIVVPTQDKHALDAALLHGSRSPSLPFHRSGSSVILINTIPPPRRWLCKYPRFVNNQISIVRMQSFCHFASLQPSGAKTEPYFSLRNSRFSYVCTKQLQNLWSHIWVWLFGLFVATVKR